MTSKVLLTITVSILLFSCNKDNDDESPQIEVSQPNNLSSYNIYDNIIVKAEISDNKNIEKVSIELLNSNLQRELSKEFSNINENTYSLSDGFYLDDIRLESGNYFIKVKAFDGVNESSDFTEIYIQSVPKELLNLVLFKETGAVTYASLVDVSNNVESNLFSWNSDLTDAEVDSYNQRIILGGKQEKDVSIYDMVENTIDWNLNFGVSNYDYVNDIFIDDANSFYATLGNSELRKFNYLGVNQLIANSGTGNRDFNVFVDSDYIYCFSKSNSGLSKSFRKYYNSTGILETSINTTLDNVQIINGPNDKLLVVGENSGNAELNLLDKNDLSYWSPHSLPNESLVKLVQVSEGNYILALSGGLYIYQYNNNSLFTGPSVSVTDMELDKVNNRLYVLESNQIIVYDASLNLLQTIGLSSSGYDKIRLHYNK